MALGYHQPRERMRSPHSWQREGLNFSGSSVKLRMSLCPILSDLPHKSCSGAQRPLATGGPAHTPELRVTLQGEHCKVNNGSDSRRGRTAPRVSEALGEVTPAFSVALGRFLGFFFCFLPGAVFLLRRDFGCPIPTKNGFFLCFSHSLICSTRTVYENPSHPSGCWKLHGLSVPTGMASGPSRALLWRPPG